jgi:hypothetical protein
MSVVITGLGRITFGPKGQPGFATHYRGKQTGASDIKTIYTFLKEAAVFAQPIKYFSKFDAVSKISLCTCGLALWDADTAAGAINNWGIIGTNQGGCLTANLDYFRDYVDNGRKKARGKLFVYTLPSTPLAETAIALGCRGPQVYIQSAQPDLSLLLDQAGQLMEDSQADGMLAVYIEETTGLALALQKQPTSTDTNILTIEDALSRYGSFL